MMLIGNLGADPEVRHFEDGGSLARLRIATSESYTDREGNRVENTEWHTVILRRGLAGVAEKYLKKGDKVFIEGSIRTRQWQDDQGQDRYSTEIRAINMTMLGAPGQSNTPEASYASSQPTPPPTTPTQNSPQSSPADGGNDEEDDLPF